MKKQAFARRRAETIETSTATEVSPTGMAVSDPKAVVALGLSCDHNLRMNDEPRLPPDAPGGVQFAPWDTPVANDDLTLVSLKYGLSPSRVEYRDFAPAMTDEEPRPHELEAVFLSREKLAAVVFGFNDVWAFRVLDEAGLVELWSASAQIPRPSNSTFMVRGHAWQKESELLWFHGESQYSFMVATDFHCLEVVTSTQPSIEFRNAQVERLT